MDKQNKFEHFFKIRINSFRFAFQGWNHLIHTQRNAWVHGLATVCAITLGIVLSLDRAEWGLMVVAITLVWMAEAINTAIEAVVDLVAPNYEELAKVAKDCGAGGVLIAAIGAAAIGFLIFLPHLIDLF